MATATGDSVRDRVLAAVDPDEVVDLLRRAIQVPSVTGAEGPFGAWLLEELREAGADDVGAFEFAPGRPDVWGVVRGTGSGRRVMFLNHLDTVHGGGWDDRWRGTDNESPFAGAVIDGNVYGRGAGDVKAGIATTLAALRTLRRAGLRPAGDVVVVGVGDEESGEPDTGYSAGIKAAVEGIVSGEIPGADFAIYGEPTQLQAYTAQLGFIIAEIHIQGTTSFWSAPAQGNDALRHGHKLLTRLYDLGRRVAASRDHPLIGRPSLLVTEVTAGGQIAVPDRCVIKLIRKLVPGEDPAQVRGELELVIDESAIEDGTQAEIRYTAGRDNPWGGTPAEFPADVDGVRVLSEVIGRVTGATEVIAGAGYWSELGVLRDRVGIPGVYCSPGDIRNCHTLEERVPVGQLVDGVRIYSLFVAEFSGVTEA
jgi:acetylornithine deacetylase